TNKGGMIKRLGKYWIKEDSLTKHPIAIYGNQTFALVLAQIYGVELIAPDDTLIARLENEWTKRHVELKQIGQIAENNFPVFIKPVIPKIFTAGIFESIVDFRETIKGLTSNEEVLMSSIVDPIEAEARAFVLNGVIRDIALYEGFAELIAGRNFLMEFINSYKDQLPKAVVVDLAFNKLTGWFILEFNACWGAGLNNCKAEAVIDCIIEATIDKRIK
ncbi:MAG TPA: ATP-grasp domain-containing protein, partial [Chitinophaga sp.]|uniref:ATP-grasp domain-containing protein n=1 Tax=Chitinophaga sp. TaxID=1869181 RepID=UPI002F93B4D5